MDAFDDREAGRSEKMTDGNRSSHPVERHRDGYWTLRDYADVAAALTDPRLSNRPAPFALLHARNRARYTAADVAASLIAFRDGPDHAVPRRQLMVALNAVLEGCEVGLENVARDVLYKAVEGGTFDLVEDFCAPYAELACAVLIGFPKEDAPRIAKWSSDFFRLFHVSQDRETFLQVDERVAEFRAYVDKQIDAAGAPRGNDFLSQLQQAKTDSLTKRELADNVMLIASDAIENVRAGLAVSALALIERPGLLPRALGDGASMRAIIEEAMRLDSPGQFQGRIAT